MTSEQRIQQQVQAAFNDHQTLHITGGNSKAFYGHPVSADQELSTLEHSGIISYEPSELVITVKSGTPLTDVEALLAEHDQQLPFEPPDYNGKTTIGGMVAAGLSGPRRPYAGAVRDSVLGVTIINGKGKIIHFGGEVMKNVAGYDVSRLITGSLGTLGVILDVSIKTRPAPLGNLIIKQKISVKQAIATMRKTAHMPITQTASVYENGYMYLRLCGAESALQAAKEVVDGEVSEPMPGFWASIKNHRHEFFHDSSNLWRVSVQGNAAMPDFSHESLIEWNGALRWIKTDADAATIRAYAKNNDGHATRFNRSAAQEDCFQEMPAAIFALHQRIKHAMDPKGIFNPGRMYEGL